MSVVPIESYGLHPQGEFIIEEFREKHAMYEKLLAVVRKILVDTMAENHIYVNAIEARVKDERSLVGKLERKGEKYHSIMDLTDILGARVITFYYDEVDKIAAIVGNTFEVDWENSIDKRKVQDIHSFGYSSLHYICRVPQKLYQDPEFPELNDVRFEIQMRTALQHVWSVLDHDTGYKSGVEIPKDYLRSINRLAGLLELADEQFCQIRTGINEYRRRVQSLVSTGKFEEVSLDGDSYANYLKLKPFDALNHRIASINQAEISNSPLRQYLDVFKYLQFKTLGDLDKFIKENSDDAFQLAASQLANTDLDIISSSLGVKTLITVYALKNGLGPLGLKEIFDILYGPSDSNKQRADRLYEKSSQLSFMQKK